MLFSLSCRLNSTPGTAEGISEAPLLDMNAQDAVEVWDEVPACTKQTNGDQHRLQD